MTSTDIEVMPVAQSFPESSSPDDSKQKSNASSDPHDSNSHSDGIDNSTTVHKFLRSNKLPVIHKIRITKARCIGAIPLSIRHFLVFAAFTGIAMAIGILTIYCTSPKPTIPKCELNFKRTASNPIEYNYGPRSVAVGDFNSDTWSDMVVANSIANNIAVYFGYSNGIFSNQMKYPTGSGSSPYMVVVGDFNNDQQLDIAVANFGTNNIGLFLGLGNGSFERQKELSTGSSRPISISVADFNNDTLLDIATANYGTQSISLFYGCQNGSFSNPMTYSTGYDSLPSSLAVGDFNNDNYLDLAIVNYGTDNVGVLLANGNGTFASQITFSTGFGSHPYSIAVGHFNGDNLLDIAIANHGSNTIGVLLGNGNGTFLPQQIYPIDSASPYTIGVGDLNQDNQVDLVVTNEGKNNIGVLLGYGNGTFQSPIMSPTGSVSTISCVIDDFNKDRRPEIIVVNNDTGSIDILFGYFEGFSNPVTYGTGSSPYSVAVGDFNNDTQLDIVVANEGSNTVSVLLGYDNGSFSDQMTYATGSSPRSVAVSDFNNDIRLDIVVTNWYVGGTISVFLGYDNIFFVNETIFTSGNGSQPRSFVIGDFNNDNRMDIGVANSGTDNIAIFLGYGNISFASPVTYSTGSSSSPLSVAAGDFNNDTLLDIAVANYGSDNVGIFLGYGNGSFRNQTTYFTGSYSSPYSVAVGDFNNDTILDIVVANYDTNSLGVFTGYGDGTFVSMILLSMDYDSRPFFVVVGDFNSDRKLDLAVANNGSDSLNIFLQTC